MSMTRPVRAGLAASSGLLLSLSFPSWASPAFAPWTGWLAWAALVPFLFAVAGAGPRFAAVAGWVGGTVFFASTLYWFAGIAELGPFAPVAWLLVAAAFGIYWAALGAGLEKAGAARAPVFLPAAWTALELMREVLFTGFPWANLGLSQWAWPGVFLAASWVGAAGISLAVVAANVALWAVVAAALRAGPAPRRRDAVPAAAVLLAALFLMSAAADRRLARDEEGRSRVRVAALQGSFTEREKWRLPLDRLVDRFARLAGEAAAERPQLMVWPETATASVMEDERRLLPRLVRIARKTGTPQIVGALMRGPEGRLRNGAFLVTADGIRARYAKTHLVPFGEYVPAWFRPFRRLTEGLLEGLADLDPGERIAPLTTPSGLRMGIAVCYEAIFPEHARALVRTGAEIFVNITNDAWYGLSAATYQHALGPIARSVECGRYTVRCANTGVSVVIDPRGKLGGSLPLFEPGVVTGEALSLRGVTVFAAGGRAALAAWTALAVLLGLLPAVLRFRRQRLPRRRG